MKGLGTLINTAAILLGGTVGLLVGSRFSERFQKALMKLLGLSTLFVGMSGALTGLLTINEGRLETSGTMLMIFSLVIGGFIGEALKIEDKLDSIGDRLKALVKADKNSKFTEGFVTSTLVVCVGAMAVVGSLQDGLSGDYSMLAAKSILDGVIMVIFASTLGVGALFSAIPLFVYQGGITLLAGFIEPFLSNELITSLSAIGSTLIFAIGVNLAFGKKFKTGNMLPALVVPVVYEVIMTLI